MKRRKGEAPQESEIVGQTTISSKRLPHCVENSVAGQKVKRRRMPLTVPAYCSFVRRFVAGASKRLFASNAPDVGISLRGLFCIGQQFSELSDQIGSETLRAQLKKTVPASDYKLMLDAFAYFEQATRERSLTA